MKQVLIVGGPVDDQKPREVRSLIAPSLRQLGRQCSAYFGDALKTMTDKGGPDWSEVSLLVVALTGESQRSGSPANKIEPSGLFLLEQSLVQAAARRAVPICVICDSQGNFTAPYLQTNLLNAITLVAINEAGTACNITEVYENVGNPISIGDLSAEDGAKAISQAIAELMPAPRMLGEGVRHNRRDEKGGWHRSEMTE